MTAREWLDAFEQFWPQSRDMAYEAVLDIRGLAEQGRWADVGQMFAGIVGSEQLCEWAIELELASYACEDEGHGALKNDRLWSGLKLVGRQDDGLEYRDCPSCASTLGKVVAA